MKIDKTKFNLESFDLSKYLIYAKNKNKKERMKKNDSKRSTKNYARKTK